MARSGCEQKLRRVYVLAVGICLMISGCAALGPRSEEARAAIVGMDQRELLSCLGPPDDLDFNDEQRYFLYRLDFRHEDPALVLADLWSPPALCGLLFPIDQGGDYCHLGRILGRSRSVRLFPHDPQAPILNPLTASEGLGGLVAHVANRSAGSFAGRDHSSVWGIS